MHVKAVLAVKGGSIITLSPQASLAEAAKLLAAKRIGTVLITDGDNLLGILSERDIVRAIATDGPAALDAQIEEHMTRAVKTAEREDTLRSIMERMTQGRFRHMPVIEEGRLVGIISIGDVVKHRLAEIEAEASAMRDYIASA